MWTYGQIRGRLPLLEQLELRFKNSSKLSLQDFRAFEDALRLRELIIGRGPSPVHEFTLPWSQITSLYIDRQIDPDDLRIVFSISPNLQSFRMTEQYNSTGVPIWEPEEPNDFMTSSIRYLHVGDPELFPAATFPCLEEISIEKLLPYEEHFSGYGKAFFRDFFRRSQCPVRKITISLGDDFTDLEMLCSRPSVQKQLGDAIAELFISRYYAPTANLMLSVDIEVQVPFSLIPDQIMWTSSERSPCLLESFWDFLEARLMSPPGLYNHIVIEKGEGWGYISYEPTSA